MKALREMSIVAALIVAACIAIGVGAQYIFKADDTMIEEIAEDILETKLGIEIDFSWDSPEDA